MGNYVKDTPGELRDGRHTGTVGHGQPVPDRSVVGFEAEAEDEAMQVRDDHAETADIHEFIVHQGVQ
jgi:hypothetical protein